MIDWSIEPSEVVIICTCNRPDDLAITLRSVVEQSGADERAVLIVDGSDEREASRTAEVVEPLNEKCPVQYHRYTDDPSGTRQRNAGIDRLPPSVQIVHFLDDDVTLKPGYFDAIAGAFSQRSELLGVGGIISPPHKSSPSRKTSWMHRLFLLSSSAPSRVLLSGQTSPAWSIGDEPLQPAEWLSTCASSYRRCVFQNHRFDPEAEGPSPRLEDLDFSYRVAQDGPLAVSTKAHCVHRVSPANRRSPANAARERLVRRYWFITKNMGHLSHYLAFWWSTIGKFLARMVSTHPKSSLALRGLLQGVRIIWTRDHPLLRRDE